MVFWKGPSFRGVLEARRAIVLYAAEDDRDIDPDYSRATKSLVRPQPKLMIFFSAFSGFKLFFFLFSGRILCPPDACGEAIENSTNEIMSREHSCILSNFYMNNNSRLDFTCAAYLIVSIHYYICTYDCSTYIKIKDLKIQEMHIFIET